MISCLCPTYGRTALLEEAVESFLRQDYGGEMELVICNDLPSQTLVFEHPRVTVVNLTERCANLGEKRNVTASYAKGEWLMTWGDDDIHLPWRIQRLKSYAAQNGLPFCLEGFHYVLDHKGVFLKEHSTAGAHIILKTLHDRIGGIAPISSGEDVEFNDRVRDEIGRLPSCKEPPGFLYRWHSNRPHVSGQSGDHYKAFGDRIDILIARGEEPQGVVHLQPQWRQPWLDLVSNHL